MCRIWGGKEVVKWDAGLSAEEEAVWGESRRSVGCTVVCIDKFWQVLVPTELFRGGQGANQIMQGAIESFNLAIALGMTGG